MAPFFKHFLEIASRRSPVAISVRLYAIHRVYPPPPLKLSHRYATEVDFQIYEMGPLAYYMADDFFIRNPPLIAMPGMSLSKFFIYAISFIVHTH